MIRLRMLPMTAAAGALALTSFAAAPARADDRALFTLLAGAAAVAIIAGAADASSHERVARRDYRDYRPAPPAPQPRVARWQHHEQLRDRARPGWWHDRNHFGRDRF